MIIVSYPRKTRYTAKTHKLTGARLHRASSNHAPTDAPKSHVLKSPETYS